MVSMVTIVTTQIQIHRPMLGHCNCTNCANTVFLKELSEEVSGEYGDNRGKVHS